MSSSAESVYVVQHLHAAPHGDEDEKLIGVYSSEQAASEAVTRLTLQPGFCEHPDGFHISAYEIDKDHWAEGFVSWREAMEERTSPAAGSSTKA
jgi:hypothetical protein